MPRIGERTRHFTESVIRRMTRVANQAGAINLSQGFPDFDPPLELMRAAAKAGRRGPHQYAVTWGAPAFREALARTKARFMGIPLDPDRHLVVTCGVDAILTGARPVYVALRPPDFAFDPGELRYIAGLAEEFDAFVITDEVYEHIVYAPFTHTYFASLPGMFERTLSCSSLSKTYSITGWRLGYVIAAEEVIQGVRKAHDFLTVGAAAPLQEAAVAALDLPDRYYRGLLDGYTRRRDVFLDQLSKAGLAYTTPQGAYYVLVDISEFGSPDDTSFCEWMARDVGVAAVPGSSFFSEPVCSYIRFHFAKKVETLVEAGRRLRRVRDAWSARRATA